MELKVSTFRGAGIVVECGDVTGGLVWWVELDSDGGLGMMERRGDVWGGGLEVRRKRKRGMVG